MRKNYIYDLEVTYDFMEEKYGFNGKKYGKEDLKKLTEILVKKIVGKEYRSWVSRKVHDSAWNELNNTVNLIREEVIYNLESPEYRFCF